MVSCSLHFPLQLHILFQLSFISPSFRKLCYLFYAWDELPAHAWPNPKATDDEGKTLRNFTVLGVKPIISPHTDAQ